MSFDPNDEDTKNAIDAAVSAAVEKLETKNRELIGKLKKANAGSTIDPAEHEALETERDTLKQQLAEANKAIKTATKQAEDASKALEGERGFTSSLLVDNGLKAALMENGVTNTAHLKAATAMLKTGAQIDIKTEADGSRKAYVGDKALGDYAKEWASSDEGKHFVTAANNGGGGAGGGGTKQPPNGGTKADMGGDKAARHARIDEMRAAAGLNT